MRGRSHRVIGLRPLTEQTYKIRVTRGDFHFKAGQCVSVGPAGSSLNREYSIYSGVDDDYLEFLIREIEGGTVSPLLKRLSIGQEVEINGAYGEFIFRDQFRESPHLFIGTGTGVAPFHSIVRSIKELNYRVVHGIRFHSESYDASDYEQGRYFPCFSKQSGRVFEGRVDKWLQDTPLDPDSVFYLCGNRNMISGVYEILRNRNMSSNHIFTEVFF